jgi:hypothetical protein
LQSISCSIDSEEEIKLKEELINGLNSRQTQIKEIQESLPKPNGLYLNIVLGGINISLIDSEQRFKYKEQYERFKLVVTCFILVVSSMDLIFQSRSVLYLI